MSRVLALVPDLMDQSKVVNATPDTQFVNSSSALRGALSFGPEVVVIDLSRPGAVDAAKAAVNAGARVVAFGSHVQRDLLAAARDAGCDEVMPRSAFFTDIEARLAPRPGDKPARQSSAAAPEPPVEPVAPVEPSGAVALAAEAAAEATVAGLVPPAEEPVLAAEAPKPAPARPRTAAKRTRKKAAPPPA